MEVKPGYKQTEVGVIPEDWDIQGLLDVARVASGQVDPKNEPFCSMVLVAPDHIESGSGRLLEKRTAAEQRAISGKYLFEPGDVIYSKIRPYLRKAILADFAGLCSADMYPLKPAEAIHGGYLLPMLLAHRFSKYAESVSIRSGMPKINRSELADFSFPVPDISEQRAIATALSDMDALLDGLDRLVAKKRAIKQATMQQLLTGQIRLPGFSGEWTRGDLKELVSTPITDGPHLTPKFYDDGVPFLSVNNLVNNRIDLSDLRFISKEDDEIFSRKCKPKKGDILLGKAASVGKVAIVENDFDFNIWSPIALIRPNNQITSKFTYYQLLSMDCLSQILILTNASSQGNIGMSDIEKIKISYPCIEEQTAIATILTDMDAEITALETRRTKTHALKQAMMQELLTGRIRLVMPASESSGKVVNISAGKAKAKVHNWQINEAVVISVLASRFGSEQYPLGRKRCTKLAYLMHRYVEYVAEGFRKKAAGPYNPDVKYRGPEGIAQKNGYIRQHRNGQFSGFVADQNIAQAEAYFIDWYGQEVLDWLEQFRKKTNDELELLTTVDMSVEDLERKGSVISLESVKTLIAEHPEWKPKLERPIFSDINIKWAIDQSRKLFAEQG
ncbi:restriction endonuclease subunit S [Methylobacillus pratensis]